MGTKIDAHNILTLGMPGHPGKALHGTGNGFLEQRAADENAQIGSTGKPCGTDQPGA